MDESVQEKDLSFEKETDEPHDYDGNDSDMEILTGGFTDDEGEEDNQINVMPSSCFDPPPEYEEDEVFTKNSQELATKNKHGKKPAAKENDSHLNALPPGCYEAPPVCEENEPDMEIQTPQVMVKKTVKRRKYTRLPAKKDIIQTKPAEELEKKVKRRPVKNPTKKEKPRTKSGRLTRDPWWMSNYRET